MKKTLSVLLRNACEVGATMVLVAVMFTLTGVVVLTTAVVVDFLLEPPVWLLLLSGVLTGVGWLYLMLGMLLGCVEEGKRKQS